MLVNLVFFAIFGKSRLIEIKTFSHFFNQTACNRQVKQHAEK